MKTLLLRRFFLLGFFAAGLLAGSASATIESDGALDPTFNAGTFTNGQVNAAILQPDGKLIIGGQFSKVHGTVRHNVARLNADGTVDPTFDPGDGPDSGIGPNGMTLLSDGKIIICGSSELFSSVNGIYRPGGIARLNADGSLDQAYNPGRTIALQPYDDGTGNALDPGYVRSVVLQTDGKIVVAGNFYSVVAEHGVSVPRSGVARFNSDGTFDPTYDPGTGLVLSTAPSGLDATFAIQQRNAPNNGKVILGGHFDKFDGHPVPGLVRLNTDGSFESTF